MRLYWKLVVDGKVLTVIPNHKLEDIYPYKCLSGVEILEATYLERKAHILKAKTMWLNRHKFYTKRSKS